MQNAMQNWKAEIITLTEGAAARAAKIDASFFPGVPEARLAAWETAQATAIPAEIRSYLAQSDGLEAAQGQLWPVWPLARWEWIGESCAFPHPWIRFGESATHFYLLSLGHSPSVYRHERAGSEEEFFAPHFRGYLAKVFGGEA